MAERYLAMLQTRLAELRREPEKYTPEEAAERLIEPVMEIKSNASMFNYPLAGLLSNLMLDFLEALGALEILKDRKGLDEGLLDIVDMHRERLHMVIDKKLQGMGPAREYGPALGEELLNACRTYFQKHAQ